MFWEGVVDRSAYLQRQRYPIAISSFTHSRPFVSVSPRASIASAEEKATRLGLRNLRRYPPSGSSLCFSISPFFGPTDRHTRLVVAEQDSSCALLRRLSPVVAMESSIRGLVTTADTRTSPASRVTTPDADRRCGDGDLPCG